MVLRAALQRPWSCMLRLCLAAQSPASRRRASTSRRMYWNHMVMMAPTSQSGAAIVGSSCKVMPPQIPAARPTPPRPATTTAQARAWTHTTGPADPASEKPTEAGLEQLQHRDGAGGAGQEHHDRQPPGDQFGVLTRQPGDLPGAPPVHYDSTSVGPLLWRDFVGWLAELGFY